MHCKADRLPVLCLVSALIALLAAEPAEAGDPELRYQTIQTEHFRIHFHQGLEPLARLGASIFEEEHENLSILFGWELKGPTDVVLYDTTDQSNGLTYILYRPVIRLYVTAPDIGSELQEYDHWLRTLFIHEYTHMVSLRIHKGLSRVINAIFGNVYLPNTLSPTWYHEGITVLNETYLTSAGRIRSERYRATIRTAALEGTLLGLGQVSNGSREFPRGSAEYVYGALFFDYLRRRFGMEKVVRLYHNYGSSLIPYGMNRNFKEVFGTDLVTLYAAWIDEVKKEAEAVKTRLVSEGLTESTRVTRDGEYKGRPVFAPDGKSVYLSISNGIQRAGIYRVPIDGSGPKGVVLSDAVSPISIDRASRIFYTRAAPYKSYYYFSDVFALDRPGASPRRVTVGARARGAAISPKGDLLAMAINHAGTSKLVLADEHGHLIRTLIDSLPSDQVYLPAWSPDGRKIAVTVRREPQVDIAVVDIRDGVLRFKTEDRALESGPVFDPTGRYLVYASDRTGISNLYALDLEKGRLSQLTNVLTGAYSPAVSPDGKKLAFIQYSSQGYDLHVMPFAPEKARRPGPAETEREAPRPLPEPSTAAVKPYNPLPSLAPAYWMINFSTSTQWDAVLQLETALTDAVGRHQVGAQIGYDIGSDALTARGAYAYTGLRPGFHVGLSHTEQPRSDGYEIRGDSKRWIQEVTRGGLGLSVPILGVDRSHSLSFGYSVVHARPRSEPEVEPDPRYERPQIPEQYVRAGFALGWSFSDLVSSPLGISPHQGRQLSASVEFYDPVLGGDQTLATFRYNWTEYIRMPWLDYHVLALQLYGGIHVSDPPEQASFSVGSYGEQNVVDAIWNSAQAASPPLRGYPANAFQGDQFHSLRIAYRFPIWFAEAAYATIPVYLRRIQAGVFTDNVLISYDPLDTDDWRSSLGAELVWLVTLGYFQTLVVRTGYAYGFMKGGMHEFIFALGGGF